MPPSLQPQILTSVEDPELLGAVVRGRVPQHLGVGRVAGHPQILVEGDLALGQGGIHEGLEHPATRSTQHPCGQYFRPWA
jgi:hypothetical protein